LGKRKGKDWLGQPVPIQVKEGAGLPPCEDSVILEESIGKKRGGGKRTSCTKPRLSQRALKKRGKAASKGKTNLGLKKKRPGKGKGRSANLKRFENHK